MQNRLAVLAASIATLIPFVPRASAQTSLVWDGGGATGNWADVGPAGANWVGDLAPVGGEILTFAGTTNLMTVNNLTGYTGHRLVFVGPGGFTLSGNALTLADAGASAPKIVNSSPSLQTIDFGVTLDSGAAAGNIAEINPVDGSLMFGGAVSLVDVSELRIFGENGNSVFFNAPISGNGSKVVIREHSVVVFDAANTYTGNTLIEAGELQLGLNGSLAAGTTIQLGSATNSGVEAVFSLGATGGGQTVANSIIVTPGNGINRTIRAMNFAGTSTISGNIALDAGAGQDRTLTFDSTFGGTLVVSGVISGAGQGIVKNGSGTLTLSGTNTYSGTTYVNSGILSISAEANLGAPSSTLVINGGTVQASATFNLGTTRTVVAEGLGATLSAGTGVVWTIDAPIVGPGDLVKMGAGTVTLTNPANAYANTSISAGTLALGASNVLPNTQVTMMGGTLSLGDKNDTIGTLLLSGGAVTSTTGVLTAGTFDLQGGSASAILAGTGGISKNGFGNVTLTGANTFTGGVTINGGVLSINADAALGHASNTVTLNGGTLNATTTMTFARPILLNEVAGNGLAADANQTLTITDNLSGNGGFIKSGAGTVELAGTAPLTFTQTMGVTNGVLLLNKPAGTNAIPAVTVEVTSNTNQSAIVRLAAPNQIHDSAYFVLNANGGQSATLDLNGLTETLNGFTVSTTSTGLATGTNGIRTGASGVLVLHGDIIFNHNRNATGNTGRELLITGTGTYNTAAPNTGTLDFGGVTRTITVNTNHTQANPVAIIETVIPNGGIIKEGNGHLSLNANSTFTGGIVINGGRVRTGAQPNSFSGNWNVNAGGTAWLFTIGANSAESNAALGAAGNGFILNGGTLLASFSSAADRTITDRPITITSLGATIEVAAASYNNFTEATQHQLRIANAAGVFTGAGSITKNGGGRLTLNNTSPNFSGPWIINSGTLEAPATNRLGDASATNTVTINGGNVALAGIQPHAFTLNGGAISNITNTGTNPVVLTKTVDVVGASHLFLNDFYQDTGVAKGITVSGTLSGTAPLNIEVNRLGTDVNSGTVTLQNVANTFSGGFNVGKNLNLVSNSSTGTGSTLGTSAVTLSGGHLHLRDNGSGNNGNLAYGNNVTVVTPTGLLANGDLVGVAALNVDRSSGLNFGNLFQLGTLSMGADLTLDVLGANGYRVSFAGVTTLDGNVTFNTTTSSLALLGGISGGGDLIKSGAGKLTVAAPTGVTYAGTTTINGGTLQFNAAAAIGGSGASIVMANGSAIGAGYAMDQTFINRVQPTANSIVFALGANSTNALDFSAFPNARLGASDQVSFTGNLQAMGSVYRLGGGDAGHTLSLPGSNVITGVRTLDVGTNGTNAGVVALDSSNDFIGSILLSGGELLRAASNASLGHPTNVITADGGGIQFAAGAPFDLFAARTVNFAAGGFIMDTNGNDYTPSVAVGNNGVGGLTKAGNGVLTLSTNATYAGTTSVTGGVLSINDAARIASSNGITLGGTLRYTGNVTTTLGKTVVLSTNGSAVLQATATTGNLSVDQIVSGGPTAAGATALTITGSGTTTLGNAANSFTGNIVVDGGTLAVAGQGTADATRFGAGTKSIILQNGGVLRATGTLSFDPNNTKSFIIGSGGGTIEIFNDVNNTTVGVFDSTGVFAGTGTFTKTGAGRLVLGTAAVGFAGFSGNVILAAGQLDVRNPGALGTGNAITVQGGTLRYQQDNAITFPHAITVTGNSTINVDRTGANAGNVLTVNSLDIGNQTLTLTNANTYRLAIPTINLTGNANFNVGGTTNLFTATGTVAGAGFGFTKTGAQPMTLGSGTLDVAPNTYTGVTTVSAGTLTLDKQAGLAGSGGVGGGTIVGDNNLATPDVVLNGTGVLFLNDNEQIANSATLNLDGGILNLNGKTETVHAVNFNGGSIVRGTGGVLNITTATSDLLLFDGDNLGATVANANIHYVGATTTSTVANLTLSAGSHIISVANGTAADDLSITGVIDGAGQTFTKSGSGVLLLTGNNTFGGAGVSVTSTAGGSIAYTTENAFGDAANAVVVAGGGFIQPRGLTTLNRLPQVGTGGGGFDIPSAQTTTVSGSIGNAPGQSGALMKTGAGTLILTGANTFDGGVTGVAGVVRLNGGTGHGPIGTGPITLAGGTVELRNDTSNVYGNHVNPVGNGTLVVTRVGTTATNQTITLGDLGQGGTGLMSLGSTQGYIISVANVNLPGGLIYGNSTSFPDMGTSTLLVAPGGNVTLGNGTGTVRLGSKNVTNTTGTIITTFDASAAATFVANTTIFEVGVEPGTGVSQTTGTLRLPASASIAATNNITFGDSGTGQGGIANVFIGGGTTSFNSPLFIIGGRKGTATVTAASGATVQIGTGSSRTQLIVGRSNVNTGVGGSGNFDLSGGDTPKTLIANLHSVVVGEKTAGSSSAAGNAQGTWNLGASPSTNVNILNPSGIGLLIGHITPASGTGTPSQPISGTVTISAGSLNIATTDNALPTVRLGAADGTYAASQGGHARGILNLNGGNISIINTGTGPAVELTPTHTGSDAANRLATAQFNVAGANVSVVGDIAVGTATGAGVWSSTIAVSAGVLDVNGNDIGNVTDFAFTGGTLREVGSLARSLTQNGAGSQFLVTGNDTLIAGSYILSAGSAAIDASRTLNPSGGTVVAGGNLLVHGTLTGTLNVSSGTVRGDGLLGASTFTGGILSPGTSAGLLRTGNLTLETASSLMLELGDYTPGTGYDQINVTGGISLSGTLSASLINDFAPVPFAPFYVMLNDSTDAITGTFAGLPEGALLTINNVNFNITYTANGDGGAVANDIALIVAPEPSGALLMLAGLGSMLAFRRRRAGANR